MNKKDMYLKKSEILSNKVFLRLTEKTQVLLPKHGRSETVMNRFSHTLDVENSAKIIANSIQRVNVDYQNSISIASLLHDIGHPANGHEGATLLNKTFKDLGLKEGFDDNNNNFIVIEKNQIQVEDYDLASILKYPSKLYQSQTPKYENILRNSIDQDIIYFESNGIKINKRPERTIACEIMDEADRNSYICSDLADCYSLGFGDTTEIVKLREENNFYSNEIQDFLVLLINAIKTKNKSSIKREFNKLKNLFNLNYALGDNIELLVKNEELLSLREKLFAIESRIFIHNDKMKASRKVSQKQFKFYIDYVLKNRYYPSKTYKSLIENSNSKEEELRYTRDMLAETTDWFIINFYEKHNK
jgi:dGTP triphosphohydrolase